MKKRITKKNPTSSHSDSCKGCSNQEHSLPISRPPVVNHTMNLLQEYKEKVSSNPLVARALNRAERSDRQVSKQEQLALDLRLTGSVFNTKETFLHFGSSERGADMHRKAFFLTYYKKRNFILADKLESIENEPEFDDNTRKVIRNIRWCSSRAIVSKNILGSGEIIANSQTCKNPHCATCARRRSAKLGSRFAKWMNDPVGKKLTEGKYWYFMTFTLKHNIDEDVRTGNYLKELRKHMAKFVRQKSFANQFGKVGKTWQGGYVTSYEMTLGDDGYHIHAHMLCCGNKVTKRFQKYEKELQDNWMKLTGDSWNVRFDAVKPEADEHGNINLENGIQQRVLELYKYTTKLTRLCHMSKDHIKRYATWSTETKGKNFVNASGIFRGQKLTAAKSPWDEKGKPVELNHDDEYFFVKTKDLRFNYTLDHNYKRAERKRIFKDLNLEYVEGNEVIDVTSMVENAMSYVKMTHDDFGQSIYGNNSRFEDNELWFELSQQNPINLAPMDKVGWRWQADDPEGKEPDKDFEDGFMLSPEDHEKWKDRMQSQLKLQLMAELEGALPYDETKKLAWNNPDNR